MRPAAPWIVALCVAIGIACARGTVVRTPGDFLARQRAVALFEEVEAAAIELRAGPSCDQVCAIAARICEAAEKICEIARDQEEDRDLASRCERARGHCREARGRCEQCRRSE